MLRVTAGFVVAFVAVAAVIAGAGYYFQFRTGDNTSDGQPLSTVTDTGWAPPFPVSEFGPVLSLNQAEPFVGSFNPPTILTNGLTLQEIRGTQDGVFLIYESASVPTLANYNYGSMIIGIQRDNTSYVPFPPYQVGGQAVIQCDPGTLQNCTTVEYTVATAYTNPVQNIVVSGHPGHGWDPDGPYGIGVVTWWANGLHYGVAADLPMSTLLAIAQSMDT